MAKWPIYNLTFPSKYQMCSTMLRFQEHYESPRFRGKEFSLEEYMDWYAGLQPENRFTYFDDWGGFNVPGDVVLAMADYDDFSPRTQKEQLVIDLFSDVEGAFYVIGTTEDEDFAALAHEMVHALYYLHSDYAKAADRLARKEKKNLTKLFAWISDPAKGSYHRSVHLDECNAYACTGYPAKVYEYKRKGEWHHTKHGDKMAEIFQELFEEHMGFPVEKLEDDKWVRRRIHTVPMKGKIKRIRYG